LQKETPRERDKSTIPRGNPESSQTIFFLKETLEGRWNTGMKNLITPLRVMSTLKQSRARDRGPKNKRQSHGLGKTSPKNGDPDRLPVTTTGRKD
jgi:hypothetical protein